MAITVPSSTSSTGSSILSSLGIGSGIDINGLITKLMMAAQAPLTLLQNQQSTVQAQISAFGAVSSALSSLQTAAQALQTNSATSVFSAMRATPSDSSVVTASTELGATAGSYNINVGTLATNQIVRSNAAYSTSDTFDTGNLAITVDGTTTNVAIDLSNNTLSGIAQAINSANAGVTASVLNDGTTNHLVLSSNSSGTAGAISVVASQSSSGATQNLTDFNYSGTNSSTMVQAQAAVNASLTLNGTTITRSSNSISDAINGVTLNLTGTGSTTLRVAADTSATASAVESFVNAYNSVVQTLQGVSAYDPTSQSAQPLTGNDVILNLQSSLPAILSQRLSGIGGGLTGLADVGVTLSSDGTLSLDSGKLQSALSNPADDVASLFGSSQGFATQLNQLLGNFLGQTGAVTAQTNGLNTQVQSLTHQENQVNTYLSQLQQQYLQEFTAMDSTVSQLNSIQSYMTQQLQYQLVNAGQQLG